MQIVKKNKICIAFLGNAFYDSRAFNFFHSLKKEGFNVKLISFEWLGRENENKIDGIKIIKIRRRPSAFFYFAFYFFLLKEFLFEKCDHFFAEDIFTLPFAVMLKKIKNFSLVYDARELYPFLAGLKDKSLNQKIIASIERKFIYSTNRVIVTGEMDAEFLSEYYKINNVVVQRNLPLQRKIVAKDLRKIFNIPEGAFILVYQGVLLEGRGIGLVIKALRYLKNVLFLIFGDGDRKEFFEELVVENEVKDKVIFAGSVSQEELPDFTAGADLGLALIENISKSYYYALPNKLFEYIAAGVPALVSDLPQMRKIVLHYGVGEVLKELNPKSVSEKIKSLIKDKEKMLGFKENLKSAAEELNWEAEFQKRKGEILG